MAARNSVFEVFMELPNYGLDDSGVGVSLWGWFQMSAGLLS